MTGISTRRRVALVAASEQATTLLSLFQAEALNGWHAFRTDGCEHARFLVQMDACDVLLVDDRGLGGDGNLTWLTARPDVPVLFVAENDPQRVIKALEQGIWQWLPRSLILESPSLLAAALTHAMTGCTQLQRAARAGESLRDCRNQVTRLANLLWDAVPVRGRPRWFNQRYMLERLHEEVTRTERHGSPLSIVLGEMHFRDEGATSLESESGPLNEWAIERISRSKRTSDVAGQYGPNGFMLVLPQTRPDGAAVYCRRLKSLLEQTTLSLVPRRACLGIAGHLASNGTPHSLLRRAEEQLDEERAAIS